MKTDTKLTVKCHSSELDRWKEAAHIRRSNTSEWVRRILNDAAEKTIAADAERRSSR